MRPKRGQNRKSRRFQSLGAPVAEMRGKQNAFPQSFRLTSFRISAIIEI
jgi:hypothetical protein